MSESSVALAAVGENSQQNDVLRHANDATRQHLVDRARFLLDALLLAGKSLLVVLLMSKQQDPHEDLTRVTLP